MLPPELSIFISLQTIFHLQITKIKIQNKVKYEQGKLMKSYHIYSLRRLHFRITHPFNLPGCLVAYY